MKIALLAPSRGRPKQLHRMMTSALTKAKHRDRVTFRFRLDKDDPALIDYADTISLWGRNWRDLAIVGPNVKLAEAWNECWKSVDADIYGMLADDVTFDTYGWDNKVAGMFDIIPDKLAWVHGTDGYTVQSYGTHGFLSREWCNILGYFVPPYFEADYVDSWLNNLAFYIGRNMYINVRMTHHHYSQDPTLYDATYAAASARRERSRLEWAHRQPELQQDANKLLEAKQPWDGLVQYTF